MQSTNQCNRDILVTLPCNEINIKTKTTSHIPTKETKRKKEQQNQKQAKKARETNLRPTNNIYICIYILYLNISRKIIRNNTILNITESYYIGMVIPSNS
jgi:hypothetical protein